MLRTGSKNLVDHVVRCQSHKVSSQQFSRLVKSLHLVAFRKASLLILKAQCNKPQRLQTTRTCVRNTKHNEDSTQTWVQAKHKHQVTWPYTRPSGSKTPLVWLTNTCTQARVCTFGMHTETRGCGGMLPQEIFWCSEMAPEANLGPKTSLQVFSSSGVP